MTNEVMPEQREKLARKFQELSKFMWWETISSEDDLERALILVDEIVKAGWRPPQETVKEEWRDIPGYSFWQMSNGHLIRHKMSHVQVEMTYVDGDLETKVLLHDDQGNDVMVLLSELIKRTWSTPPTEETFLVVFGNGNTVEIPHSHFTGKSTNVKTGEVTWDGLDKELTKQLADELDISVELIKVDLEEPDSFAEEWRPIESIVGLEAFDISNYGSVRYRPTGRIIEPSFDCGLDKHVVKLNVNGKNIWVDGPFLAAAMWEH